MRGGAFCCSDSGFCREEQRRRSLHHAGERGGDFDGGNVALGLHLLEHALEFLASAAHDGRSDLFLELDHAQLVDVGDARHLHFFELLAVTRSMTRSMFRSRGLTNRMASPVRPARPVRPMRCT